MSQQISPKINDAGVLYSVDLDTHRIYNIFTKTKNYRGGKVYSKEKAFILLSGRCILTTESNGEDIEIEIYPGEKTIIPANTPNLFYFPEDTEMLEWFPKNVTTKKVERYYEIKKSNHKL